MVTLTGSPASAFPVSRVGDGAAVLGVSQSIDRNHTSVALAFVGWEVQFGSLVDGRYSLTVAGAEVTDDLGQPLARNAPGGNFTYAFHRLFGDADVNGAEEAIDLGAFRQAFGTANII